MEIVHDSSDTLIEIGSRVAYNLSGYVYIGRVTKIVIKYKKYPYIDAEYFAGTIFVENEKTGVITQMKNPRSIAVIS